MTERRVGKPGPSKPLRGYGSMKDDPLTKQISAAIEKRNEVIFENASLRARIHALETALEPFAKIKPSSIYAADGSEDEWYTVFLGECPKEDAHLTGADLARARSVLSEKTAGKPQEAPEGDSATRVAGRSE